MKKILMGCLILASLAACCKQHAKNEGMVLYPASAFDTTIHGKAVSLYTLRNANGMTAQITNYGGIIVDLWVPAKGDSFCNVVLGYSSIREYLTPGNNFAGAITGRFANRIANGRFTLDSVEYNLPINNGPNTLHGGIEGFSKKVWDVCDVTTEDGEQALMLTYVSKDGEENF
ncbi:MAG: galactose-1-epimerase, partial [Alistipes sp.]|nr:galactose-1-epimerase [Alistipes sp.]